MTRCRAYPGLGAHAGWRRRCRAVVRQLDAAHPDHLHHAALRAPSRSPGRSHVRCPVMTITIAGEALVAYLLASVRIVAWLAVVPPFSSRAIRSAGRRVAQECNSPWSYRWTP